MGQKTRMDSINTVVGTETAEYSTVSDRRSFSERYNFSFKDIWLFYFSFDILSIHVVAVCISSMYVHHVELGKWYGAVYIVIVGMSQFKVKKSLFENDIVKIETGNE